MIPLLVGIVVVAGAGIGWVGYKANARIAEWGKRMNEIDDIFRMDAEAEHPSGHPAAPRRQPEEGRSKTPFAGQHLPTGPAASR